MEKNNKTIDSKNKKSCTKFYNGINNRNLNCAAELKKTEKDSCLVWQSISLHSKCSLCVVHAYFFVKVQTLNSNVKIVGKHCKHDNPFKLTVSCRASSAFQ